MQFEVITKEQVSEEVKQYLEFRFAPLWAALKDAEAIRVPLENGQTINSFQNSMRYGAKQAKQKVRILRAGDGKSLIVVRS